MSMESNLMAALLQACPRVYPDVAPAGAAKPYAAWQAIGGESLGYLDNTAADKRSTLMQISVYATSRLQALQIARDAEALMRASAAFVATPQGEAVSTYEEDTQLYGCIQRFVIVAAR